MHPRIPSHTSKPNNDDKKDDKTDMPATIDSNSTTVSTTTATNTTRSVPMTNPEFGSETAEPSDPTDVAAEADSGDPDQDADPPLPMAASVVLSSLPGDAKRALGQAVAEAESVAGAGGPVGKGWYLHL